MPCKNISMISIRIIKNFVQNNIRYKKLQTPYSQPKQFIATTVFHLLIKLFENFKCLCLHEHSLKYVNIINVD